MTGDPAAQAIPGGLARALSASRLVVFLTGAGISAESGIPTFRQAMTGLWSRFRPEELATPEAFARDPETVWRWYAWRRGLVAATRPNAGHLAIAGLQRHLPASVLVTQNVDGLHQRAGSDPVLELHGNIGRSVCARDRRPVAQADGEKLPACPRCGGPVRPDVVWFGEALPAGVLEQARQAARRCDLFFSVGTSAVVYPAAELAELAAGAGATVVEINPEPTPLTRRARFHLQGPGGVMLPALLQSLEDTQRI